MVEKEQQSNGQVVRNFLYADLVNKYVVGPYQKAQNYESRKPSDRATGHSSMAFPNRAHSGRDPPPPVRVVF